MESARSNQKVEAPKDEPSLLDVIEFVLENLTTLCGVLLYFIAFALISFFDGLVYDNLKNRSVLFWVIPSYVGLLVVAVLMTNALREEYAPQFYYMWTIYFFTVIYIYFEVPGFTFILKLIWTVVCLLPIPVLIIWRLIKQCSLQKPA